MTKKFISGLDSLRCILALWVLLSHYTIGQYLINYPFPKIGIQIINVSFVGVAAVIVFFIISGIVIHFPYRDQKKLDIPQYLAKRYIRIGLPMIGISLIALYFNKFFNLPFWSLYCEIIYYTLYPAFFYLNKKININYAIIVAFIISYITIFIFSDSFNHLIHQIALVDEIHNGNYHQLGLGLTWVLGLPCWLLGLKIAQNYDKLIQKTISVKSIYIWRVLILIVSCICLVLRYRFSLSLTISLNIFALLAAGWVSKEIIFWHERKTISLLEWGGKWSYSLYICHQLSPFIMAFLWWPEFSGIYQWLSLILFSLLFSYLFYLLIEKPSHLLAGKISLLVKK
jgi:peptidoglycan/LPS O-acetylase OafA/YrhL